MLKSVVEFCYGTILHPSNSMRDTDMKTVACALPSELVDIVDHMLSGTFTTRAAWMRLAILKAAHEAGLIKLTLDAKGNVYSLDMTGAAA